MVQRPVVASLFDRLIGPDIDVSASGCCSRDVYVRSVIRDLEVLLNTRATAIQPQPTLVDFGIVDAIGLNLLAQADRNQFTGNIASAITTFEPRLKGVQVSYVGQMDLGRRLLLEISAFLVISNEMERLVFKTQYQPVSSLYQVQRG